MSEGMLITFEGTEGCGKTTVSKMLRDWMENSHLKVRLFREPGSTVIGEKLRNIVHDLENNQINAWTEALLYQACRSQLYAEEVLPNIDRGEIVILDRSRDSSFVFQGAGRGIEKKMINLLNNYSTEFTYPDLTFFMDVDLEVGLSRRKDSNEVNRMDMQSLDFHRRAKQAYLELMEQNDHGRWRRVDANQSLEEVFANVMYIAGVELGRRRFLERQKIGGKER